MMSHVRRRIYRRCSALAYCFGIAVCFEKANLANQVKFRSVPSLIA